VTSLHVLEERYFGSLTCHVLRSVDRPVFEHFVANASTVFRQPGAYDPYAYGRKTHRYFACDVYLLDAAFDEAFVDLDVALILQPVLARNGAGKCDAPLVARQTVRIDFDGGEARARAEKEKQEEENRNKVVSNNIARKK
jgi:hypothetical protein